MFGSEEDAAGNWAEIYNYYSIREIREYASTIGKSVDSKGKIWYSNGPPSKGQSTSAIRSHAPTGTIAVADIHSHGAWNDEHLNNQFSSKDMWDNVNKNLRGYLATPNGMLLRYSPVTRKSSTVRSNLPFDPYDPDNPDLFSLITIRKNRGTVGPVIPNPTTTIIPTKPKKPLPTPTPVPKPKPDKKPTGRTGFGFT